MQDELLKLQEEHQRTVIFISHDLDEAMRIGDRIAMMEGGRIVQIGTPEEILKNPADDYVRAFFRGVDPTNILSAGDIMRDRQTTIIRHKGESPRAALERLMDQDREYCYVLDARRRFHGIVSVDSLKDAIEVHDEPKLSDAFLDGVETVTTDQSLQDILPWVTQHDWAVPRGGRGRRVQGRHFQEHFPEDPAPGRQRPGTAGPGLTRPRRTNT